jgi:O-antigen ligase
MRENISFKSILVGTYLFSVPVFSYSEDFHLNMIPQFIGLIIIAYAFYDSLKPHERIKNRSLFFYFLFTIWSVVSYLYIGNFGQTEGILTLVKISLVIASTAFLIKNQQDLTTVLLMFFFSIFLTFYLNYNVIMNLRNLNNFGEEERFAGTFANANTAAIYCIAIIWAGFTVLLNKKQNFIVRAIIIAGLMIACFVIIYSGSRKGIIGLGFFSIVVAWISIKKYGYTLFRKVISIFIALCILAFVINLIYKSPFFSRVTTTFQGDASSAARLYLFKTAMDVWTSSTKNFIFGVGIDNFQFYNYLNTYSHSTISETLVCTGIVGFILFYTSFFSIFIIYFKILKRHRTDIGINLSLFFIFLIIVMFFTTTSVMYEDKLFWPILAMVSSFGVSTLKAISIDEESIPVQ